MAIDITAILDFILANWEGIIALLGFGGAAYEGKGVMDFFNSENLLANVAPWILKLFPGVHTWTLTDSTLQQILSAIPDGEKQSIINAIKAAETARTGMYDLYSSLGIIRIEYGVVMNPEILNPSTPAATTTMKIDTRSRDSDGKQIGLLTLKSLSIGSVAVVDKMKSTVSQLVGKECVATLTGKDYGSVIVGMFFDGKQFGEQVCYTKPGTSEIFSAKMPDHNSDYPAGEHILEIKQGYRDGWSSYDGTPGSSGDQTTWEEELTVRYTIDVI